MLKKSRCAKSATCTLTFALPVAQLVGSVSVVGTFNDWTPGVHVLRRRSNGTASASVTVPAGTDVRFRYLGEHGRWF
ncbi:MAG: isoamylase, partial [Cellulomonas sp.]|nr:isoamylase [Cellulomonas sp.]